MPAWPAFLFTNPVFGKYLLEGLFRYQATGLYPNKWLVHDLGASYPLALGHNNGLDKAMPVKECGNMLMSLSYAQKTGNFSQITQYTALLDQWTQYLINDSLIPNDQISTDNFAGALANQTNLAIKGIVDSSGHHKSPNPAQAAASAIQKILVGDAFKSGDGAKSHNATEMPGCLDPMNGWLEAQIVLRNQAEADKTCIVAAVQAKIQSFANFDDPITGKVIQEHTLLCPACKLLHQHSSLNQAMVYQHFPSKKSSDSSDSIGFTNHLQDQTLLLYFNAAHKTHVDHLETLLFQYDFTDLTTSAEIISDLQRQVRKALDVEHIIEKNPRPGEAEPQLELMRLRAHMFLLAERLNFLFEAIKLAQDRKDDQADQNQQCSYTCCPLKYPGEWHQESSTINHLTVRNLQAFNGSRDATWTEILSKYNEPAYHPLLKQGIFVLSEYSTLPPVGGITIYESFELSLHPLQLQIDAKVGHRIIEYGYPSQKSRHCKSIEDVPQPDTTVESSVPLMDSPGLTLSFEELVNQFIPLDMS
ncbi:hypothetical protein BT96DRAFT_945838 [Gymnopus androsaceus JB14]|uniref:Glutaminase A central domain-containing protein n=1 Tax=Gymnopus androsaceus JB14 TaxID=1447944 RepID=A0A6A4GYK1_9AGAR|nr:hypothetical protein BT96DRAFT_945838 [Gymnopus androsaceus JB14]